MATKNEIWAPCNNCGCDTRHIVLMTDSETEKDEQYGAWWQTTFKMIKCAGCDLVILERSINSSEFSETEKEYFPPVVSRRRPKWAVDRTESIGPRGLLHLLHEVYLALHADSRRLATMGARALLDMVLLDKVGDLGGFGIKLNAMQTQGFIAPEQRKFLEALLEVGNASAHRGHYPSSEDLDHAMDILENMISQIYLLPAAGKSLKRSTPRRREK